MNKVIDCRVAPCHSPHVMHKYEFTFDSNEWPLGGVINNDILHQRGDTFEGAQEKLIESFEEQGVKHGNIVSVKKIS